MLMVQVHPCLQIKRNVMKKIFQNVMQKITQKIPYGYVPFIIVAGLIVLCAILTVIIY